MSKYDVFCDESGYLEHDIFQYMLNGGIWCEQEARRKINSKIIEMKNMSNFAGEVETSRASPWHLKPFQASLDLNPEFFAIVRISICSFHPGL